MAHITLEAVGVGDRVEVTLNGASPGGRIALFERIRDVREQADADRRR
jgi:hypothetical protein